MFVRWLLNWKLQVHKLCTRLVVDWLRKFIFELRKDLTYYYSPQLAEQIDA